MRSVGKREFSLHASKYLKQVEETGEGLAITHRDRPTLKLVPIKAKTIRTLAGTITGCKIIGDINEPVFPRYHSWLS